MEEGECYNLASFRRLMEGMREELSEPRMDELGLRGASLDKELFFIRRLASKFPALLDRSSTEYLIGLRLSCFFFI